MKENNSQLRTYLRRECIVFRKTKEKYGGLSNMASGFPIVINGVLIPTSEALYQACRFPHQPEVQEIIIAQKSPMTAKMKSKPHRANTRADWDDIRVNVMRWCLRVKLSQNLDYFGDLLKSTQDKPIVEESKRDPFWGAKPIDEKTLEGCNVLGRLLMELRLDFNTKPQQEMEYIQPPNITDFLFLGKPIGEVGKEDSNDTLVVLDPEQLGMFPESD